MASKRNAKREAGWREVVARQVSSGLSVRAFCQREGLAESNFYAWRRELRLRDREAVGARSKPAAAFLPAVVTDKQADEAALALQLVADGTLQLRGSAEQLAQLLAAWQQRGGR